MKRGWTAKSQREGSDLFKPIHGMRNTPTGSSWVSMMSRCFNKNFFRVYALYGARGITVCKFLCETPRNLVTLIGERPPNKTLDRINGKGNYSCGSCENCKRLGWPLNVRWATDREQSENRSTNVLISSGGETKCVTAWAREIGVNHSTIYGRVKRGASIERLLSQVQVEKIIANGESKTVKEWSEFTGIKIKTLRKRMADGCTGDEIIKPLNHAYIRTNYRQKRK